MPSLGNASRARRRTTAPRSSRSRRTAGLPRLGVQVEHAELVMLGPDDRMGRLDAGEPRLRAAVAHDHVLRNHSVGSTCSAASRGERLCTVMRHRMSSGPALAYSTSTSK